MPADVTIRRFVRYIALGEMPANARTIAPKTDNVPYSVSERTIYSYGRHFPLATLVPAKRGKPALFVINGDRWRGGWGTTNRHQEITRREIASVIDDAAKIGKRIDSIIIPMSAITGALIDLPSIRPLDIRDDRQEIFDNYASLPGKITLDIPTRAACIAAGDCGGIDHNGNQRQISQTNTLYRGAINVRTVSRDTGETVTSSRRVELTRVTTHRAYDYARDVNGFADIVPPRVQFYLDGSSVDVSEDGALTFETRRHWLGDSLFTADVTRAITRRCLEHVPSEYDATRCANCRHYLSDHGTYRDTVKRRYRFVSSFDYNEPAPLYFLAALPASSRAMTVTDAIADLAPASVHAAMSAGLDVKRQGDIFFIPTSATDETLAARGIASRARLTQWTRNARARKGETGYAPALTAAQERARKTMRVKRYREIRAMQLATAARPTTPNGWRADKRRAIAEARATVERLQARARNGGYNNADKTGTCYSLVTQAAHMRRAIANVNAAIAEPRKRDKGYAATGTRAYGACYRRALSAHADATRAANDKYVPVTPRERIRNALSVIGTAHTATQVVKLNSGATFVAGTVRHVPEIANERRASDHRALDLVPDVWYLAVRNTVPRNRTNNR